MSATPIVPPTDLQAVFAQANALLAGGDAHAALLLAQQAWTLAPQHADLCNLLGVCAISLGDKGTAEQCWLHTLLLAPHAVDAHYNLALHYADSQRRDEAARHFRLTLAIAPAHAGAHARLGWLLAGIRGFDENSTRAHEAEVEAEQCYRRALALNRHDAASWGNLGLLLERCRRLQEAEQAQQTALMLAPDSPELHANFANLLARMERVAEAEQHYRRAIALDPCSAPTHANLGVLLADAGRDDEAEQALRQALALAPAYQQGRRNLSMLLLAQGRFDEGWRLHEARYHPDLPNPDAPMPNLPCPPWQGEALAGKSLLVWPEQGYGDMLQFCRFLPQIKQQGAARITLVCRRALAGLMATLAGVDAVFALDDAAGALQHRHDYWTLPMSLPLHCGADPVQMPGTIPTAPYLHAPQRRASRARGLLEALGKLPSGTVRIGLTWQGNPQHANDARRSLSGPAMRTALEPLWAIAGVQFVSLQYNAESAACPAQLLLDPGLCAGEWEFADTAALVEQLDLVISVDTAVVHLAGALGKPCWVLLPAQRCDWRWLRARNDSPWYPHMRLFRQAREQDWQALITELAQALRQHVKQHQRTV